MGTRNRTETSTQWRRVGYLLLCLLGAPPAGQAAPPSGVAAQDFLQRLVDTEGRPAAVERYAGRVLLVNFWASWCPPCIREMPSLERLAQDMDGHPFRLVMVNVDEPVGVVLRFQRLEQNGIVSLRDPDGAVARSLDITIFPTSLLIDASGIIRERLAGEIAWDSPVAAARLESLLSEAPADAPDQGSRPAPAGR